MALWLLLSKVLKGCDKWIVQPFLSSRTKFNVPCTALLHFILIPLCPIIFLPLLTVFTGCAHCIHSSSATPELPRLWPANLLLHFTKRPLPFLSVSLAVSLTSPSLIFHPLSNLSALTGCIFHLLWHENMAPISWEGGMERERWPFQPEQGAKHLLLSLGSPPAPEMGWLSSLTALESGRRRKESFFLLFWTHKYKTRAQPTLCTAWILGIAVTGLTQLFSPCLVEAPWSHGTRGARGSTWPGATCNLLLAPEISQEWAEQSHVLRGATGTILSKQRYAEAEVLARLYSVPYG